MSKNRQGVAMSMHQIREILKLNNLGYSQRKIAQVLDCSKSTVLKFLRVIKQSDSSFEELNSLNDVEFLQTLDLSPNKRPSNSNKATIDFKSVHDELAENKHVTLELLWQEYKENNQDHYGYSSFCDQYRTWKLPLNATLRKNYVAGEFLFVDFSGSTVSYYDSDTKEYKEAQVFLATLGCSNFTYCEASSSQKLKDWIKLHINCFEYLGGVPKVVVPDNLKSGVTKACIYDPELNSTYHDMANHYDTVIIPARSRKPKDKAKVEGAVLIAQRWILAKLRRFQFFSISEINEKIFELLIQLNQKKFQKLEGSRESFFETIEKKELQSLPQKPYEIAIFSKAKVNIDYHIEFQRNYYSVPWKLISKHVIIRATDTTVEILFNHERVASHLRSYKQGYSTTNKVHRPPKHEAVLKWNPKRLRNWATSIGPFTYILIDTIFKSYKHEDYGIRKVLGILNLSSKHSNLLLNQASFIARKAGYHRLKQIRNTINNIETGKLKVDEVSNISDTVSHENIRGAQYYKIVDEKKVN